MRGGVIDIYNSLDFIEYQTLQAYHNKVHIIECYITAEKQPEKQLIIFFILHHMS